MNDYQQAIDNHNVARGDQSWFENKIAATGDIIMSAGTAISAGAPSAVVAGVNSILNTGVAVANFLGAEFEPLNTYNILKDFDSDLGRYYKEHETGVETAGFIATSLLPGMAGVKAVQAAKAGVIGSNMAKSSGLMTTLTYDYAKAARVEIASGNSPFSLLETNTAKALIQGFGANALEAAAFETAVIASMYKSPVLDGSSLSDISSHIITGTFLGGGIGGLLHGVVLSAGIKKAGAAANKELFPYRNISELGDLASPDLRIINYYQQKLNLPEPALLDDVVSDLTPEARINLINTERTKTTERLDILIKQELNKFAGNDAALADQLKVIMDKAQSPTEVAASLINSKGISRITESEKLVVGDVLFPMHKMNVTEFNEARAAGSFEKLFVGEATDNTQGFRVIGDIKQLKITGAGVRESEAGPIFGSKESAFNAGYDVYRNSNGIFSVNPVSKILESSELRRTANNLILDFKNNGNIVDKATASIADFVTKEHGITVSGNSVIVGKEAPIQIGNSISYSPITGSVNEAQARYIWALQTDFKFENKVIGASDLPLLEKAYYLGDKVPTFQIKLADGKQVVAPTGENLRRFIEAQKFEMAKVLDGKPLDEIAFRLNVSENWLYGGADEVAAMRTLGDFITPRYGRVDFGEVNAAEAYNANMLGGLIEYERQVQAIRTRHQQNTMNYDGDFDKFPNAPDVSDPGRIPRGYGAGSSLFGFSNAALGSYESWAQFVGSLTNKLKLKKQTETAEILNPALSAVALKGPEAIAELSLVTTKLRNSPEAYVFHPMNPMILVSRKELTGITKGTIENPTNPILIKSSEVADLLKTHSEVLGRRQQHVANLKSAAGVGDDFDYGVVYAPPINTSNYKHFVIVEPRGINLTDKKRVIAAKDEAQLQKMIGLVDQKEFRVWTKQDKEEWHKALGDYDFSLGMNESLVDSTLNRKGVLADFLPTTESKRILDDYMEWHMGQASSLATRMVEHRYSPDFQSLRGLGKSYTDVATSQFRSLTEKLEQSVKDPYNDIVKTALDISRASEYQWWTSFNDFVRNSLEAPINKLKALKDSSFGKSNIITDDFVAKVNKISEDLGLGTPYKDSYAAMVANGNVADKPWLAKGISKAQSVLTTSLLQLDFFNAINNTIATPIIMSAEISSLMKAIRERNPDVAGKLVAMMDVKVPDGSELSMPTTQRLISNAITNYRADHLAGGAILKRYEDIRAVTNVLQQERQMLDNLTLKFTETSSQVDSGLTKAIEAGKRFTGNKLAEEMQRFISADVMRQITDFALEAGVLKNVGEANEYILNFVNKTQGNYLYSQRPIVFQGVVGQAVSLFQTYQFNLMQQLFRYVGEGDKKALGILLGLQGSIYGMQGLPAFNFINTHIVGNASGNTNHRDLYQASYSVFGKELGDWILYGAGSNALGLVDSRMRINLYSRGDINPRQLTVLPTSLSDIPIVSASTRFAGNLWNASEKISKGGAFWPTLSQAVEHNGISRPLAGLAQVAQGYTTTNQGSLLSASQDFWLVANLSRVGGGKPFDEAVALDALYRINAYKAKDIARIQSLGSTVKTTVMGGGVPSEEQVADFAKQYAKSGGRIESFNRFFSSTMMNANRSQVNKLAENLNSPFAKQMQVIMGGTPVPDYLNQPSEK